MYTCFVEKNQIFARLKGCINLCKHALNYIYWRHCQCTGALSERYFFDCNTSEQQKQCGQYLNHTQKMLVVSATPNSWGWNCNTNLGIPRCQVEAVITNMYLYRQLSTFGVNARSLDVDVMQGRRNAIFGSMLTSICTIEHDVDYRLLKVPGTMQLIYM